MQGVAKECISELMAELPSRWEKLGALALLPRFSMSSPDWAHMGLTLWRAVAAALGADRVAMQAPVANTGKHLTFLTVFACSLGLY